MPAETIDVLQAVFARLARDHPDLTDTDRSLMAAFERLMLGRPEITDGTTTVTNICAEAGVSRASYYRSPVAGAVKEVLKDPQARRPELDKLCDEVRKLCQAERKLRSEHAAEVRELRGTAATYANQIQIQVLALANHQLREDNRRLQARLTATTNVVPLPVVLPDG
jgi:hypothetical protein